MSDTHPNTELYALGKGRLAIALWSDTDGPNDTTDFVDVGNCPSFEIEPVVEKLEHFSSRSGARVKDKIVVVERKYTLTFELDEISSANMAKFMLGTISGAEVRGLMKLDAEYAVKFISDNVTGRNYTVRFWKVNLNPNGAFQLIGDEWMTMSFTGEGLSDSTNHATSPYYTFTFTTTSTTSSTTSTSSSSTTSTTN